MATVKTETIISKAKGEIGVKESPMGSNNVKYNTWYYGGAVSGSSYPWCCAFVNWVFSDCGAGELFYDGKKTAYCPTAESWFRQKGQWHSTGKTGDLIFFDWDSDGVSDHIGIVENVSGSTYTTIEGNTSDASNSNGGTVARRTRSTCIRGFGRPAYEGQTNNVTTDNANKAEYKAYSKEMKATCTGDGVNVRKGAGTGYASLGTIKKNVTMTVYGYYDAIVNGHMWYKVKAGSMTGYMAGNYIKFNNETIVNGYTVGKTYTVQPGIGLNVRKSASTSAAIVKAIPKGTKVICQTTTASGNYIWMKITEGYVCAKEGNDVYMV